MPIVMKFIVGGWIIESALIVLCALNESGGLIKIHKRIGKWLEALAPTAIRAPDE